LRPGQCYIADAEVEILAAGWRRAARQRGQAGAIETRVGRDGVILLDPPGAYPDPTRAIALECIELEAFWMRTNLSVPRCAIIPVLEYLDE
jgi:hypothetical protein